MTNLIPNWKKEASMQFNKQEVEQAFMTQAYGFIQNKAGRLLTDPHRLGFEIVYKNDANTRLVGIFAFKSGKELIYAPCFFINGEVKGTDLLYQHAQKMFKPLTEEWVEYLLEKENASQGRGFDDPEYKQRDMDLQRMIVPPDNRGWSDKAASESPATVFEAMKESRELGPILRDFLLEDGGIEAMATVEKMATASFEFAKALSQLDPDTWAPEGLEYKHTKEASENKEPGTLKLVTRPGHTKDAGVRDNIVKRGYDLIDYREDLTPVEVHDVCLESAGVNGVYNVLTADGDSKKAIVLLGCKDMRWDLPESEGMPYEPWNAPLRSPTIPKHKVIYEDGTVCCGCNPVFGEAMDTDADWCKSSEYCLEKPKTGSTYICYDPTSGATITGKVKSVKDRDGILNVQVLCSKWDKEGTHITVNPNLEESNSDYDLVHCKEAWWIKVTTDKEDYSKGEKGPAIGDALSLEQFLMNHNYLPIELRETEKSAGMRYEMKVNGKLTEDISKMAMTVKLARDLKIKGEEAIELMDKAAADHGCRFWASIDAMKKSGAFYLMEEPDFLTEQDSEFNVPVEMGSEQTLDVESSTEPFPDSRIGDAAEPEGADLSADPTNISDEEIMGSTPEALAQLAQVRQLPEVFEHGLVGTLAQAHDAGRLIQRYTPNLEEAVDSLGRILFLFYWKPGEMQDAYGTDDMQQLEDQLLDNFQRLGELTLELLKRSPERQISGVQATAVSGG